MAELKKRIKVLVITELKEEEEEVTEKKEEKQKLTEEDEGKISDKESYYCDLEQKEVEEAEASAAAYALKGKAKMNYVVEKLIQEEKAAEVKKNYCDLEQKEVEEAEASAAAYALKGKAAKMSDLLVERLIQEEEKAEEKKKPLEVSIQEELAERLNVEVDMIFCRTTDDLVTDDLAEIDMGEIKVVIVEEIFFLRILHLITNVPEFVSIRFVFCSSNPKWQVLHKTSEYKKGSSAGLHVNDIPGSFLGNLMETCYCIPEIKHNSSSHSDNYGHDDEGDVGEEEELQVPGPPQQPMKLKKRWHRDWDQQ